ncbi:MAG: hypothetical protein U0L97_01315 [Candidatus Saccharimonadaceae bacterium]|nr:hypothetical protein [Candidatus Saccharimonadaceae bacterium]
MSVAPITPKEAQRQHLTKVIPDEVYEAVNEILAEKYCDSDITIYQNEVISRAIEKMQIDGTCVPAEDFFKYHWLDFETPYMNSGWAVSFVKPAYNESFEAHWVFNKPCIK